MSKKYDASWDEDDDEEAFDRIYAKWEKRSWESWLRSNLKFPFQVERMEDDEASFFTGVKKSRPFQLGHIMEVTGIEAEDEMYGIIVNVREGKNTGYVPLCDVAMFLQNSSNPENLPLIAIDFTPSCVASILVTEERDNNESIMAPSS